MRPPRVGASCILSGRGSVTGSALWCSVSSTPTSASPRYIRAATSYESPPPRMTKYGTQLFRPAKYLVNPGTADGGRDRVLARRGLTLRRGRDGESEPDCRCERAAGRIGHYGARVVKNDRSTRTTMHVVVHRAN